MIRHQNNLLSPPPLEPARASFQSSKRGGLQMLTFPLDCQKSSHDSRNQSINRLLLLQNSRRLLLYTHYIIIQIQIQTHITSIPFKLQNTIDRPHQTESTHTQLLRRSYKSISSHLIQESPLTLTSSPTPPQLTTLLLMKPNPFPMHN